MSHLLRWETRMWAKQHLQWDMAGARTPSSRGFSPLCCSGADSSCSGKRKKPHAKIQHLELHSSKITNVRQYSKHLPAHFWFFAKIFWPKIGRKTQNCLWKADTSHENIHLVKSPGFYWKSASVENADQLYYWRSFNFPLSGTDMEKTASVKRRLQTYVII